MKTLILLLMSYTVLFSLTGKEITITEGLWYISFPENSGEIKASEMAYRFNPDGSAEMVLETGMHPGQLKDMVCSPGGTTIEATAMLEKLGFRSAIIDAMKCCTEKSNKLSK